MHNKEIAQITQKVEFLQKELAGLGPVMRGSIVKIGTRNKQFYFSLNKDKKTKLIYLGKKRVEMARQYSNNYKDSWRSSMK